MTSKAIAAGFLLLAAPLFNGCATHSQRLSLQITAEFGNRSGLPGPDASPAIHLAVGQQTEDKVVFNDDFWGDPIAIEGVTATVTTDAGVIALTGASSLDLAADLGSGARDCVVVVHADGNDYTINVAPLEPPAVSVEPAIVQEGDDVHVTWSPAGQGDVAFVSIDGHASASSDTLDRGSEDVPASSGFGAGEDFVNLEIEASSHGGMEATDDQIDVTVTATSVTTVTVVPAP